MSNSQSPDNSLISNNSQIISKITPTPQQQQLMDTSETDSLSPQQMDNSLPQQMDNSLPQQRNTSVEEISPQSSKYGNMSFISFFAAVLARLAYFNDNQFLNNYNKIIGPVITEEYFKKIDDGPLTNLSELSGLLRGLDILQLEMPQKINEINGEYWKSTAKFKEKIMNTTDTLKNTIVSGPQTFNNTIANAPQTFNKMRNIFNTQIGGADGDDLNSNQLSSSDLNTPPNTENSKFPNKNNDGTSKNEPNFFIPDISGNVTYISIGWSNYGEVYVVADKKMPKTLFVLFRGTYSAKTASIYSKPTSQVPLTVCEKEDDKFLYGIYKVTDELIHTIVEAMLYLAVNVLKANGEDDGSIKIFTTGHSLGGGMCTIFAYLWMKVKEKTLYKDFPYSVLSSNIICISLAAPRCMNESVANKFCEYVKEKRILYKRIISNGDPVTAMPFKMGGYVHPCSKDEGMRLSVIEACVSPSGLDLNTNYNLSLNCKNYADRKIPIVGNAYIQNTHSHAYYLYISYLNAINPRNFIPVGNEVSRDGKDTVCRLICGYSNEKKKNIYNVVFFNVTDVRNGGNPCKISTSLTSFINSTTFNKKDTGAAAEVAQSLQYTADHPIIPAVPAPVTAEKIPEDLEQAVNAQETKNIPVGDGTLVQKQVVQAMQDIPYGNVVGVDKIPNVVTGQQQQTNDQTIPAVSTKEQMPTPEPAIGGDFIKNTLEFTGLKVKEVVEDTGMTSAVFQDLISKMTQITYKDVKYSLKYGTCINYCPMSPSENHPIIKIPPPTNIVPRIGCPCPDVSSYNLVNVNPVNTMAFKQGENAGYYGGKRKSKKMKIQTHKQKSKKRISSPIK